MPDSPARFLVVLDADSTLLADEAIELLAEEAGTVDHVRAVTLRAMQGELDFAESLAERVATLAGLDANVLDRVIDRMVPTVGAADLVAGVHRAGGRIGVVSGGFHELLDPVATALGLDHCRANRLEIVDGRLTGRVLGAVIDAAAKADTLREWAGIHGVPLHRTMAVGDGANDLDMMAVAGLGVAFNAKPLVREKADLVAGRVDLSELLVLCGALGD